MDGQSLTVYPWAYVIAGLIGLWGVTGVVRDASYRPPVRRLGGQGAGEGAAERGGDELGNSSAPPSANSLTQSSATSFSSGP